MSGEGLRDRLAEAIYGGGDEPEWLTTVDDSPNSGSYEHADRVLAVLVPMLAERRCPGCGNVLGESSWCRPLDVDVTQVGYRYLAGRWGYCRTLHRFIEESEGPVWLATPPAQASPYAQASEGGGE